MIYLFYFYFFYFKFLLYFLLMRGENRLELLRLSWLGRAFEIFVNLKLLVKHRCYPLAIISRLFELSFVKIVVLEVLFRVIVVLVWKLLVF